MTNPTLTQMKPRLGTYVGVFMVTLTTLMYEIVLTRIFSVTMGYHFAFASISIVLLGLTVGALIVHLQPNRFRPETVRRDLWITALAFAVAVLVCFAIQLQIKFQPHATVRGVASAIGILLVISIPFILSGMVVCLALTRFPDKVNRLYAADLVGAALGALVLVLLLNRIDAPSVVAAIGALGAVGALAFALDAGHARAVVAAGIAGALLVSFTAVNALRHDDGDAPLDIKWIREMPDGTYDFDGWSILARINVGEASGSLGWGLSSELPPGTEVDRLRLTIDNVAGTDFIRYDGDPDSTDFLRYDIPNLFHYLRDDADVLVVGTGGGRDILSALEFDQRSVTGVDINGQILDLLTDTYGNFTGHLDRDPRVTLAHDDARSFVTRSDERFDAIQISLIDTFSAGAAGAYALTENSLYTTEAWETFLDHLKPNGIFSVTRWYNYQGVGPVEVYRAVALASQALTNRGVTNPRDHILVYRSPFVFNRVATVLVSPDPFSPADLRRITNVTEDLAFDPVLTPDSAVNSRFAALARPGGPDAALDQFESDVSPPSDNRPFFFQMVDLGNILQGEGWKDTYVTRPVLVLALLAIAVLALTALLIGGPLAYGAWRRRRQGLTRRKGLGPYYGYFAGIGLAFLLVEISQLLRLSIFLGHPIYALTVVLFSILLFSGIGSRLSERFVHMERPRSMVRPLLILLGTLLVYGLVTGPILDATEATTTPVRIVVAIAILFPVGLMMGMPLAIGMRTASSRLDDPPTAFLWGVNGAASVCASVLGMGISLFFGIAVAFWVGFAAYAVAALALTRILRHQPEPATEHAVAVEHPERVIAST